jgi:membrane protease YdiL (CAAX protease family)
VWTCSKTVTFSLAAAERHPQEFRRMTTDINLNLKSPTTIGNFKWRCWTDSLILAVGSPALILLVSNILAALFPAAAQGGGSQRFWVKAGGGLVVEWLQVLALWLVLRREGRSFRELGVWRLGTSAAWATALAFAALTIASNLRFLTAMHIPISYAFLPPVGIHLYAALVLGTTAGLCEEVLFRGFLMTQFQRARYGNAAQVIIPGLVFGLAHMGFAPSQGIFNTLGIMLPTAFIGMMWGVAYLLGRRSLLPCIAAHFLNDSTALPWIVYFMFTGSTQ